MQFFSLSTARSAGILYLVLGVLGGFSIAFLPATIHVPGDASATFENASGSLSLFRVSIAAGLLHKIILLILAFLFVHLFGRQNPIVAAAMAALVCISVAIYVIVVSDLYLSLAYLPTEADAASMFLETVESYLGGLELVSIFWGLWLLPLGGLIIKTRRVPRWIGYVLILGGLGYLLNFFGPLLAPGVYAGSVLSIAMASVSAVGELSLALWLVVRGVSERLEEIPR